MSSRNNIMVCVLVSAILLQAVYGNFCTNQCNAQFSTCVEICINKQDNLQQYCQSSCNDGKNICSFGCFGSFGRRKRSLLRILSKRLTWVLRSSFTNQNGSKDMYAIDQFYAWTFLWTFSLYMCMLLGETENSNYSGRIDFIG